MDLYNLFLAILIYVSTFLGCGGIALICFITAFFEVYNKGYKYDEKVNSEAEKMDAKKEKKDEVLTKNFKDYISNILTLIPGVNLIYMTILCYKINKTILDDSNIKRIIIPMTEEEKIEYNKIRGIFEKLEYIEYLSKEIPKEKFSWSTKEGTAVIGYETTTDLYIYDDELKPLGYTLEEVKKINSVTNKSYIIGRIEDKNVAIIGVPHHELVINRIFFTREEYRIPYIFESINEEDTKNYTIYPFPSTNMDDIKPIISEIEQLRNSRNLNYFEHTYPRDNEKNSSKEKRLVFKGKNFK